MKQRRALAAIDIGTNSFHLVVVEADAATGRFKVLDREKEYVRLGGGSGDMKRLSAASMRRGIETLQRFRKIAERFDAQIRAIATSAVREALNRDEFLRAVSAECGISVDIVSGAEEARLIYLGVLQALPVYDRRTLLVDVGGGSTEFLFGKRRRIAFDQSLKIGSVRLTRMFFGARELDNRSVKRCREYVRGILQPVARALHQAKFETIVGTSGTILSIANMVRCARGDNILGKLNNFEFTRRELFGAVDQILRAKHVQERGALEGLESRRADIIPAGAIIVEQIFKVLGIKRMVVSEYALREGIVFDTLEKKHRLSGRHRLSTIRSDSVLHLARSVGYERKHAHHVAGLAEQIFEETSHLHRFGELEREFLQAAALLHEVGLFVSHDQHHRHSYYLIRNAELLGFTEREKEIIANIARYHRKSHPKTRHEAFSALSPGDQDIVKKLAGILRIADGLDRTHRSIVAGVSCSPGRRSIRFSLTTRGQAAPDLEIWGANQKKQLFEESFARVARIL